jgi:RNA polymerase sigma-70 factor (ECF subfamily)
MKRAYSIALGFVGQHDDALDLSQEAFIRAYKNIKKYDPDRRFFPWFYQILKNLCFNHLKKKKERSFSSMSDSEETQISIPADNCFDPSLVVERNETKDIVWKAIGQMDKKHREIIILRHFQELSYDEIAEVLCCNKGTVMSRLYYARRELKELMKPGIAELHPV